MANWHISPNTKKGEECGAASPESCPFRGPDTHFTSEAEANAAAEQKYNDVHNTFGTIQKKKTTLTLNQEVAKAKERLGDDPMFKGINPREVPHYSHLGGNFMDELMARQNHRAKAVKTSVRELLDEPQISKDRLAFLRNLHDKYDKLAYYYSHNSSLHIGKPITFDFQNELNDSAPITMREMMSRYDALEQKMNNARKAPRFLGVKRKPTEAETLVTEQKVKEVQNEIDELSRTRVIMDKQDINDLITRSEADVKTFVDWSLKEEMQQEYGSISAANRRHEYLRGQVRNAEFILEQFEHDDTYKGLYKDWEPAGLY